MRILTISVALIFISVSAFAYDYKTEKTLRGVHGNVDADITYGEMFKYAQKLENLIDAYCTDLPVLFSKENIEKRNKICMADMADLEKEKK